MGVPAQFGVPNFVDFLERRFQCLPSRIGLIPTSELSFLWLSAF